MTDLLSFRAILRSAFCFSNLVYAHSNLCISILHIVIFHSASKRNLFFITIYIQMLFEKILHHFYIFCNSILKIAALKSFFFIFYCLFCFLYTWCFQIYRKVFQPLECDVFTFPVFSCVTSISASAALSCNPCNQFPAPIPCVVFCLLSLRYSLAIVPSRLSDLP